MQMTCTTCGLAKAEDAFAPRGPQRRKQCRQCVNRRIRARRDLDRSAYNAANRAYRANRDPVARRRAEVRQFSTFYTGHSGRATHMLNNARARARRLGVAMTLTREWLTERLAAGTCEATGIPFVFITGHGRGHRRNAFSPSLERLDPEGPYTPENCIVACWIYNRAKGAFRQTDFDRMCKAHVARLEAAT